MALNPHRFRGVTKNGRIELEPGAVLPDGVEVTVLIEPPKAPKKISTAKDLLDSEFFGMWADRKDLPTTNEEFREWRRRLWERSAS